MKSGKFMLGGLAAALLGSTAAFAVPAPMPVQGPGMPMPPAPMHQRMERRGPEMPEEIKAMHKEMQSLRKDMRLELSKDNPDSAKVLEMNKKAEELHAKVEEWRITQILEGKAPKPRAGGPRPPMPPRPGMRGPMGPAHSPMGYGWSCMMAPMPPVQFLCWGPMAAPQPFAPRGPVPQLQQPRHDHGECPVCGQPIENREEAK